MEPDREIFSDNNYEAVSRHMEIARLFEQTGLLIGRAFKLRTYWRQLNVIDTLIMVPK